MTIPAENLVFLLDVDNTLLDNDAVMADLRAHLTKAFGAASEQRYWEIFETCRAELGYADYLGALQRYRVEHPRHPQLLRVSLFLLDYPFSKRLFPGALDVIATLKQRGRVVILSDGDVVFQPRKVERSGLWSAVDGNVLIYIHKEEMLEDVQSRFPAARYVMVDDKLRLLRLMKAQLGDRLATVFVRQGHYAHDPCILATEPPADFEIDTIADLLTIDLIRTSSKSTIADSAC
jgi:FMN phosphatase YigB (HAD superfamily)